jgi:3-isopropylmalate dehydrogenase
MFSSLSGTSTAAYTLVQKPRDFDVVVAQDLFGDVLADVGALLLGGRGLSFSGNFSASRAAVYQTNHGGAADIARSDSANPIGQISALAFALRETFGLAREAAWIEDGIDEVLRQGLRTSDIAEAGSRVVGTREMGQRIAAAVDRISRSVSRPGGDRSWRPRSASSRNRIAADS